jgi:dCMP deaminase
LHNWHRRFIQMAGLIAQWSKDPSTKVGAILVNPKTRTIVATGYNGLPRNVADATDRMEKRPEKYLWTEHAERNAIYNAARNGQSTEGCVLYMNFEPCPCTDCARAAIQAGVIMIVGPDRPFEGKGTQWRENLAVAIEMLAEAGIATVTVEDPR